ncbi:hypothetical protein [Aestuariivirga sp.]|uniref:hypothetical protein n=1 Tax=Aestuariivirga sp. TaxID=2650926 RepID=UPI0035936C0A
MPKLTYLLVTLPLMVLPAATLAVKPVLASTAAEEAVRILSRAKAADRHCNVLSFSERSELSRYTARAEVAAASQSSAGAARSAAGKGYAEGNGASCTAATTADVRETLEAAREAVAESNRQTAAAPAKRRAPETRAAQKPETASTRSGGGGLGLYSRVVKAYYLERQCNSLSRFQVARFYDRVITLHRETVTQSGKSAVNRAVRNAERNAAGAKCSANELAQIERGYKGVSSR